MAAFVTETFVPVKIHIKEQPAVFERFKVQWTPTILVLDPDGTERHRFEGFLPLDDFLAQLHLGLARAAFERKQFDEAEKRFREIVQQFPKTDAAPESVYWAAVSNYKATGKPDALGQAAQQLKTGYPESVWTKKASVWAGH